MLVFFLRFALHAKTTGVPPLRAHDGAVASRACATEVGRNCQPEGARATPRQSVRREVLHRHRHLQRAVGPLQSVSVFARPGLCVV